MPAAARFRALVALASFDPDSPNWHDYASVAVEHLLKANPLFLRDWTQALQPAAGTLVGPLANVFRGLAQPEKRQVAAEVLAMYARDNLALLADLVADSDADQFAILLPLLERQRESAKQLLQQELARQTPEPGRESDRVVLARRRAVAATALLRLGQETSAWKLLRHSAWPDARAYLIRELAQRGVEATALAERLGEETDVSARRALILALGEYSAEQMPADVKASITTSLLDWYRKDPDAGIHGAVDWLLRHSKEGPAPRKLSWDKGTSLTAIDKDLAGKLPAADQNWFVTKSGFTMTAVRGPVEFRMGSPATESERVDDEIPHRRRIDRGFAVAVKGVTVAQFQEFLRANPRISHGQETDRYSPELTGPAIGVSWYDAAQYCRWLSEAEGIPESEMCYPSVSEIEKSKDGVTPLRLPANYLRRRGYRMPTEAEYEFVCRAGAETARHFGEDNDLLPRYAWFLQNSGDRTWPVGQKRPNDLGMFDLHGNAWTWCQESAKSYQLGDGDKIIEDKEDVSDIRDDIRRVLRGGSFGGGASITRSAYRYKFAPSYRYVSVGLRVARTWP
jgi:formylglycine-generating enzyme required for sulfatase activity